MTALKNQSLIFDEQLQQYKKRLQKNSEGILLQGMYSEVAKELVSVKQLIEQSGASRSLGRQIWQVERERLSLLCEHGIKCQVMKRDCQDALYSEQ